MSSLSQARDAISGAAGCSIWGSTAGKTGDSGIEVGAEQAFDSIESSFLVTTEALHTCVMDDDARRLLRQALRLMRREKKKK